MVVVSEMQAGGLAGTLIVCEVPTGTDVFFQEVKVLAHRPAHVAGTSFILLNCESGPEHEHFSGFLSVARR